MASPRLVVDEVVVVGLGVALVVVLLDESPAAQLAPVRVLAGDGEQVAQEGGGGTVASSSSSVVVVVAVSVLEVVVDGPPPAVVGGHVLLQVVLAGERPAAHLALVRPLTRVQPHVPVQLGPIVAGVRAVLAGKLALLAAEAQVPVVAVTRRLYVPQGQVLGKPGALMRWR